MPIRPCFLDIQTLMYHCIRYFSAKPEGKPLAPSPCYSIFIMEITCHKTFEIS